MVAWGRQELDRVLGAYAAEHPTTTEYDGNTFVLKAPGFTRGLVIGYIGMGLGAVVVFVWGVALVAIAVVREGGWDRTNDAAVGVFLILLTIGCTVYVYLRQTRRTVLDLSTGELVEYYPFGTRRLVNFHNVHGCNRRDRGKIKRPRYFNCHLHTMVQHRGEPQLSKVTYGYFRSPYAFAAFELAVEAMIAYFNPRPVLRVPPPE